MKFLVTLSLLLATVSNCAAQTIFDLATNDGKYGTLLDAVTNTPGVLGAINANLPVSKYIYLACSLYPTNLQIPSLLSLRPFGFIF
jgi:hypothetical protein